MVKLLLQFLCIALAVSAVPAGPQDSQMPLGSSMVGFDLDLSEQRLVQLEGQAPQWISELDKVCPGSPV